jgi:hypothetical protein
MLRHGSRRHLGSAATASRVWSSTTLATAASNSPRGENQDRANQRGRSCRLGRRRHGPLARTVRPTRVTMADGATARSATSDAELVLSGRMSQRRRPAFSASWLGRCLGSTGIAAARNGPTSRVLSGAAAATSRCVPPCPRRPSSRGSAPSPVTSRAGASSRGVGRLDANGKDPRTQESPPDHQEVMGPERVPPTFNSFRMMRLADPPTPSGSDEGIVIGCQPELTSITSTVGDSRRHA